MPKKQLRRQIKRRITNLQGPISRGDKRAQEKAELLDMIRHMLDYGY